MNLKELAALLDLSPTTVSRALNGFPEVSDKTRRRVKEVAEQHGYAPNLYARRLATGRAHAIGHVIPFSDHQIVNPMFADFIAGTGEVYSAQEYEMLVSFVPDHEEAKSYRQMAAQRKVDGFIIHGPNMDEPRIALLNAIGLPFVVHGRDKTPEAAYSWLDINNRRAFARATRFLLDLGHRKIALLNGPDGQSFSTRRLSGYRDALDACGLSTDPGLIRGADMTEPYGYSATNDMLSGQSPPTAFLTSSVLIALGVHRAIRERGLAPGRDISIVTHDDDLPFLPNSGEIPMFTATRSSLRDAGRRCAEMLIEQIRHPGGKPIQELWEVTLTLGQSTGPAPQGR